MATLDLTKYGITGTTEIVHNPTSKPWRLAFVSSSNNCS